MQFNKVLIALQALQLIFITFCLETVLTARNHQKGRSASLRIFSLHQRQAQERGRSGLESGFGFDKAFKPREGRDLMKKFLLFKSLFTQQKSEPNNNVIIITQSAADETRTPTTTVPTSAGTTTTTATKVDTPTFGGNTGRGTKTQDENDAEDLFGVSEDSKPEEIVQQLIKQTQLNKMLLKKVNRQLTKTQKQQQQQQWQRQHQQQKHLRGKRNKRKRLANRMPQTKPLRNRQEIHQPNNINFSQQPNQMSSNNKSNSNGNNSSNSNYNKHNGSNTNNNNNSSNSNTNNNNNMTSGILNHNTNMRLQNIINAFRKQTPIVYNY